MTHDTVNRPMRDLRVSVTDRCNFRCNYCMPFDEYTWIERNQVLSFEEIVRLAGVFIGFGVTKIRLTGGEPLVRRELHKLVFDLNTSYATLEVTLTTNGALLSEQAGSLYDAGLRRINVSLDTLRPDRFREITKRGDLNDVLNGIQTAKQVGMAPIKVNAVIMRGTNDDEILDLVRFARDNGFEMR